MILYLVVNSECPQHPMSGLRAVRTRFATEPTTFWHCLLKIGRGCESILGCVWQVLP